MIATRNPISLRLLVLVIALLAPAALVACGDDEKDAEVIETTPADPGVTPEREGTATTTDDAAGLAARLAGRGGRRGGRGRGRHGHRRGGRPVAEPAAAGERYARERLRVAEPKEATELPSKREPEWRLISGFTDDGKTWAVFLRREGDGWVAVDGSSPAEEGPADVPCDIRFPFSEPGC